MGKCHSVTVARVRNGFSFFFFFFPASLTSLTSPALAFALALLLPLPKVAGPFSSFSFLAPLFTVFISVLFITFFPFSSLTLPHSSKDGDHGHPGIVPPFPGHPAARH